MQKQACIPGADLETVSALLRQLAPEAEQQMAFVNEPSGRRLLSGYRTRSCVLFCARLCTFLEVYPACCSILKKQLKFFLDGDTVI